ncbi:GrpB family protein [Paenibacillus lutimineralis]|uniref:GrpB family protein n=1 Tax=Paenibacillus lutimineralis TaxID=2707005 RepID=UPI001D037AD0|nr:GrpB family protein [Paenibacillus lutimineralis]
MPKGRKRIFGAYCFSEYLRANASARMEYGNLKEQLAETYRFDIDSYIRNKTEFVNRILKKTLYGALGV